MFGLVKSEAVALALEQDPHRLESMGEEREVTVLFADIRSFTDFSERHTPQQVVALLNAYFDAVVPLIEAEGGTIDKYMGDGIMALFGAPANLSDHAARAAVAMVRASTKLRGDVGQTGQSDHAYRCGGAYRQGRRGSHRQPRTTGLYGHRRCGVNVASRIESANKRAGDGSAACAAATVEAMPAGEEGARVGLREKEPRRAREGKGADQGVVALSRGRWLKPKSQAKKMARRKGDRSCVWFMVGLWLALPCSSFGLPPDMHCRSGDSESNTRRTKVSRRVTQRV